MTAKFSGMGEGDDLAQALKFNLLRLTGQAGDKETQSVLKKDFGLPALTGDNTVDIKNLHTVVGKLINHIGGS